jgi:four helix bundle protein
MAIGSADETKVWLDFAKDLGYLTKENHERFKETYTIIAKMLSGLHRNWG